MHVVGFRDTDGNARVNLHVCGDKYPLPGLEIEGVIDSGFNGFLLLPMRLGFDLGLKNIGAGATTCYLADCTPMPCFTTSGTVTFADRRLTDGVILLSDSVEAILVGGDFFRLFRMTPVMSTIPIVYDADWLEKALARANGAGK